MTWHPKHFCKRNNNIKMRFAIFILVLFCFSLATSCNPYKGLSQQEAADAIVKDAVDDKLIKGAVVSLSSSDFDWTGAHGNLSTEDAYFIASTTKLFTTTVIYQLIDEGRLQLDDKISEYLTDDIMKGLHVRKDEEYSHKITVRHLLSNTSGLPDYFEGKDDKGKVLSKELMKGNDEAWAFEETIAISKTMKPKFEPGKKNKALYSDTNFQLLGKIIEELTGLTVSEAFEERIVEPLGLTSTYVYADENDDTPISLRYKKDELHIPKAMTSFAPDGGVVSTAYESMIFIKAFFNGELFDAKHIDEAQEWNDIFYPNEYGVGYMRYKLPKVYGIPEVIGHSGLSGAFMWYCPAKDLFITGTVNQLHKPGTSYRMVARLLSVLEG